MSLYLNVTDFILVGKLSEGANSQHMLIYNVCIVRLLKNHIVIISNVITLHNL
jgi:hypothetical protein